MATPTFKKIETGNWQYRWKYKDKFTGKPRELKRQGFRTRPEAEQDFETRKRKIELGFDSVKNETLVEYLNSWLQEFKEGKVAKNTYQLHYRNINNHIVPYFQNLKMEDLTHTLYQKFINYLLNEAYNRQAKKNGYSKRTVEIIHGTMYGAMERAVSFKKIESNPCNNVVILSTKEAREQKNKKSNIKFIPYDKIEDFLNAALIDNYYYYIFFRFLIETGVRKGEAAALQWDHVDLHNGLIKIVQTLDFQPNDDDLFGDTKTYHSQREFTIPKRLVLALKSHQVRQNDNKDRFKEFYKNDLNLVFCREDGSPLPKSTLFNAFRRILKKIDLPASLDIHSLRHTFAVLMLESEVEMKFIQEALGHGSMQITSDVYAHVSKKIENDSLTKFEKHTDKIFKSGAKIGQA